MWAVNADYRIADLNRRNCLARNYDYTSALYISLHSIYVEVNIPLNDDPKDSSK